MSFSHGEAFFGEDLEIWENNVLIFIDVMEEERTCDTTLIDCSGIFLMHFKETFYVIYELLYQSTS